jgi:hypothetical protein
MRRQQANLRRAGLAFCDARRPVGATGPRSFSLIAGLFPHIPESARRQKHPEQVHNLARAFAPQWLTRFNG